MYSWTVLALLVGVVVCADEQLMAEQFCKQFPSLHLCKLNDNLQGSLVELQYLLQDADGNDLTGAVAKRKSAFVRFGKRSDDLMESMEKRKSAFVRFGRSAPSAAIEASPEKRKSSYVRFG